MKFSTQKFVNHSWYAVTRFGRKFGLHVGRRSFFVEFK